MLLTHRRWLLASALLGAAATGCTSRTLPLPPPVVEDVSAPNEQGLVQVSGYAQEGASVGVLNDMTMTGVIVTTTGEDCANTCPWQAMVPAKADDVLRIWQFFETSTAEERTVPAP